MSENPLTLLSPTKSAIKSNHFLGRGLTELGDFLGDGVTSVSATPLVVYRLAIALRLNQRPRKTLGFETRKRTLHWRSHTRLRSHSRQWVGLIGTILFKRTSDQPTPFLRQGNANTWYSSPS